jgi:ubiquinone/menaquinone biosynthesis C-methylase UbiE
MRLDVGCGNNPTGNVNVDLFMNEQTLHVDSHTKRFIDSKKIPNPVKADAQHLPFKDDAFEEVFCSHVLEHVENPTKALLELIRVSKSKVIVVLPHRYFPGHKRAFKIGTHKYTFSSITTKEWLKKLNLPYRYVTKTTFKPRIFGEFMPLLCFPSEIRIEIYKEVS